MGMRPPTPFDEKELPPGWALSWNKILREYRTEREYIFRGKTKFEVISFKDYPALIRYDINFNIIRRVWKGAGRTLHRAAHKPAIVYYNLDGSIKYEYYFIDGREYFPSKIDINLEVLKEIL